MRRLWITLSVLFLAIHPMLRATPADTTRPAVSQKKGVNLTGTVSKDGKEFMTDDDNTWAVSNTEALKGLENQTVTVKCRIDPAKRALWIMTVEEPGRRAQENDAAFRR